MSEEKKSVVVMVKGKMSFVSRLEKSESGEKASKKHPKFPNFLHIRMDRRRT